MFLNEDANVQNWSKMLTEQFQVSDKEKLSWVSQYAAVHEMFESALGVNGGQVLGAPVAPLYANPLNTTGMGGIQGPGLLNPNSTSQADFYSQRPGSGDVPVSTLPMALNVALLTVGLELVPVVPAKSPFQMLSYLDFPYAGGKMDRAAHLTSFDGKGDGNENKPIYVKFLGELSELSELGAAVKAAAAADTTQPLTVTVTGGTVAFVGTFKGIGRNDGGVILETVSCMEGSDNKAIVDLFAAGTDLTVTFGNETKTLTRAQADFVQTSADFVDGFANFATGAKEAMTRAQNETGTGNVIGLRLFTKWIQVGSYEVTGTLTRQQLQDLPLYGVDATSKLMEAMQNELTQSINARILERVFALGVTNAAQQRAFQGVDLNLYIGTNGVNSTKNISTFGCAPYTDIYGTTHDWAVKNSETMSSAENMHTRQRRISSRVLAAANLIMAVGRRGRATWVVTNTQVASALEDVAGYVVAPMANTLSQNGTQNLFLNGTLAGLKVYVDPYMHWDDTRVCVGRKGDANSPGVVFMPYILADQVTITAEGTMAPKMLVNSRYALADIGFYPELQYYTFNVYSDYGLI